MLDAIQKEGGEQINSHVVISGAEFNRMLSPCIYSWRRGERWLYIGASANGFTRVFGYHHAIGRYDKVLLEDTIYIWHFENISLSCLFHLEAKLITEFRPKFNKDIGFSDQASLEQEAIKLLGQVTREEIILPNTFPLTKEEIGPHCPIYIGLKDVPDDFLVKKGTLYNWHSKKLFPGLFTRIGNRVYLNLPEFERLWKLRVIVNGDKDWSIENCQEPTMVAVEEVP